MYKTIKIPKKTQCSQPMGNYARQKQLQKTKLKQLLAAETSYFYRRQFRLKLQVYSALALFNTKFFLFAARNSLY